MKVDAGTDKPNRLDIGDVGSFGRVYISLRDSLNSVGYNTVYNQYTHMYGQFATRVFM